ncbi:hypothetical protein [Belnapia rosea]|uniref:hypothetical protein n=1 Tax=Belnapia rosea TaxID=938405 RepID=UPI00115FC30F|nr:hypothetical protein [Belnapia rosea]
MVKVHDSVVEPEGLSLGIPVQRALRMQAEQVLGMKQVRDQTMPIPPYLYVAYKDVRQVEGSQNRNRAALDQ